MLDVGDPNTSGSSSPPRAGSSGSSTHEISDKGYEEAQLAVNRLFDRDRLKSEWIPPTAPPVLGELMDSAFPLPLILPSDAELLAAWPGPGVEQILEQEEKDRKRRSRDLSSKAMSNGNGQGAGNGAVGLKVDLPDIPSRSPSRASVGNRGAMEWRLRHQTVRTTTSNLLESLDGGLESLRATRTVHFGAVFERLDMLEAEEQQEGVESEQADEYQELDATIQPSSFTKRPARPSRIPRESSGADTIMEFSRRDPSRTPEQRLAPLLNEPVVSS